MGNCCIGNRPGQSSSIYCISPDGSSIFEYNPSENRFIHHALGLELPSMCKYCEIPQNNLLIIGGFKRSKNKSGQAVGEVFLFNKFSGLQKLESLSNPRTGHCLIVCKSQAYLISGVISQVHPTPSCQRFDLSTNTWSEISPLSKARVLAAGCSLQSNLFITGGNPGNSLENFRDIEKYNIETDDWTLLSVKLPCDLWRHTCLAYQGGLIVFGGNCNKRFNLDCFKVDLSRNVTVQHTWLRHGGEFGGCSLVVNEKVFTFETSACRTVWVYDGSKWTSKNNSSKIETCTI
jgi:hypothetical protein